MTTYILHGGATSRPTEDNKKFFFEMVADVPDSCTILCVYFSRPKEEWGELLTQDKERISSISPKKKLNFVLASDNTKIFTEQIKKAGVLYMRGGKTDMLLEALKPIEHFGSLLKGKIVAGSSAGACVLSTQFYTGTNGSTVRDGLGILQIKIFVHYGEEKKHFVEELEKRGEKLPIYKIPEETFYVIEQE